MLKHMKIFTRNARHFSTEGNQATLFNYYMYSATVQIVFACSWEKPQRLTSSLPPLTSHAEM